jgi:hypothetical protein
MEGFLLCAASVAMLVGLGALAEAARPRRGGPGGFRTPQRLAGKPVLPR